MFRSAITLFGHEKINTTQIAYFSISWDQNLVLRYVVTTRREGGRLYYGVGEMYDNDVLFSIASLSYYFYPKYIGSQFGV